MQTVDFLGPVPLELFQGFEDGKARRLDAVLDGALEPLLILGVNQAAEVFDMAPGLLGGRLSQFVVLVFDERQLQRVQLLMQQRGLGAHGVFFW